MCEADAASRPVEVLLRKGAASASGMDLAVVESPDVVWLTGLGYGAVEALAALQANAGDREAALASLYAALTGEYAACKPPRCTDHRFCLQVFCSASNRRRCCRGLVGVLATLYNLMHAHEHFPTTKLSSRLCHPHRVLSDCCCVVTHRPLFRCGGCRGGFSER